MKGHIKGTLARRSKSTLNTKLPKLILGNGPAPSTAASIKESANITKTKNKYARFFERFHVRKMK
jgi:hypothetical protein